MNHESDWKEESLRCGAAEASSAPRKSSATASEHANNGFLEFYALAETFSKTGKARRETVEAAYRMALSYPDVTPDSLFSRYETYLVKRQGQKYTGDYVLKWLKDPSNYVRTSESKPSGAIATDKDSAEESLGPKATNTKTGSAKDRVFKHLGWTPKMITDTLDCEEIG